MSVADKQIAMHVRREVVRRAIDASQLFIHCTHGTVELGGRIKPLRKGATVDFEHELHIIRDRVIRIPGVRDVVWPYLDMKL
jgi:hypothetical protein